MLCSRCQQDNPTDARFCNACGAKLQTVCPQCAHVNPSDSRFCNECGVSLRRGETTKQRNGETEKTSISSVPEPLTLDPRPIDGERRQLTVMFCDLVGSTALSEQLDPEDYHGRVRAYQAACRQVIARYDGYIAQYLGDGVLAYFGYPTAHEEDAARAVRSGLEIVAAVGELKLTPLLQVRIGIHTGQVVVGEIGAGERTERLALGETPNVAARVQGHAEPNTVVISAVTHRLVQGLFEYQDLGLQQLKGLSTPLSLYGVVGESAAQSRFEVAVRTGLTPLIGREAELGLLWQHWEHAKAGAGQVVLLSGEPGIGKSRLVQELKEQLAHEGATPIEFRCSPYHQNSTLYPVMEHLQRLLQFERNDSVDAKLNKLQQTLSGYQFPEADTMPLLAALLSLPHPESVPPITMSPQKQRAQTQAALVAWLVEETERQPVYTLWEDLHWADPSTLEVLKLLLRQVPTTRLLAVLTFRPEFILPWGMHSYLSPLTLSRLEQSQVSAMVERVTGGKLLPEEVVQQIVTKTDGVPLFVEELTKMVVESSLVREENGHYELTGLLPPLAIPSTLQDSLMARLDRLAMVREVAQLGATLGREFSYELISAVTPFGEESLQQGLKRLVETELVYQRGLPPQAQYLFKHALIQDTAYQSLLKSTRQQYHGQIAQVLAARFPETVETQPELLAHHYTEAGLVEQAIPYWQRAGERAVQRSAYAEAIAHLTRELELLQPLPETLERAQHELRLQTLLGTSLIATKGYGTPEVGRAYARAQQLCHQVGEGPQLSLVLHGLRVFYLVRGELLRARELAEQLLRSASHLQDPAALLSAHLTLGETLYFQGELPAARTQLEQARSLYDPKQHSPHGSKGWIDRGVASLSLSAMTLWLLGYPEQAQKIGDEALILAQRLAHPFSHAFALFYGAVLHGASRKVQASRELAEAAVALATTQGFPQWVTDGTILRGAALVEQGQVEIGIDEIQHGLAALQALGADLGRPGFLTLLAEAYGRTGQVEKGLALLTEALAVASRTGEHIDEAELYRLKGELTLQQFKVQSSECKVPNTQAEAEAEACFQQAIEIAQKQSAKSLELRAVMSLARLWQQQAKTVEAQQMLSEIYGWFTEGFDTKDLQDAKTLLDELAVSVNKTARGTP